MHITDLPDNPFWSLFSSDHLAGILMIVLVVVAFRAVWYQKMRLATTVAVFALMSGLVAFELATTGDRVAVGSVALAAVWAWLATVGLAAIAVGATSRHLASKMLFFGFLSLAHLGLAIELSSRSMIALAIANLVWWFALVAGISSLLSMLGRGDNDEVGTYDDDRVVDE